jgi:hypothetical protein
VNQELMREFEALEMQLRGYEVARLTDEGWEQVNRFSPDERGLSLAKKEVNWFNWRHGKMGVQYRVRPIISINVDFPRDGVNVGDAIVTPAQLELPLPVPEESLILNPEGTEFAGTGFVVPDKDRPGQSTEVPFDYDRLAGELAIPDPWGDK